MLKTIYENCCENRTITSNVFRLFRCHLHALGVNKTAAAHIILVFPTPTFI